MFLLLSALAVQALPNFLCDGEWCEHLASGPCPPLPKDSFLGKTRSQLQRQRDLEARRARGYADIRGTHASQAAAQLAAQAPADKDYDTDMDVTYESASMSASEGDSESEHDSESASESSSASESASESEIERTGASESASASESESAESENESEHLSESAFEIACESACESEDGSNREAADSDRQEQQRMTDVWQCARPSAQPAWLVVASLNKRIAELSAKNGELGSMHLWSDFD